LTGMAEVVYKAAISDNLNYCGHLDTLVPVRRDQSFRNGLYGRTLSFGAAKRPAPADAACVYPAHDPKAKIKNHTTEPVKLLKTKEAVFRTRQVVENRCFVQFNPSTC
jgi:hypothetical protein